MKISRFIKNTRILIRIILFSTVIGSFYANSNIPLQTKPDADEQNLVLIYADLTNLSEQFTADAEKAANPAQVMKAVDKYLKNSKPLYDKMQKLAKKNKTVFKSSSEIVRAANNKWQNAVSNLVSKESNFFPKYEKHRSLVKKWKLMRKSLDKFIVETENALNKK